jgi:hypothetical protein
MLYGRGYLDSLKPMDPEYVIQCKMVNAAKALSECIAAVREKAYPKVIRSVPADAKTNYYNYQVAYGFDEPQDHRLDMYYWETAKCEKQFYVSVASLFGGK